MHSNERRIIGWSSIIAALLDSIAESLEGRLQLDHGGLTFRAGGASSAACVNQFTLRRDRFGVPRCTPTRAQRSQEREYEASDESSSQRSAQGFPR